MAKTCYRPWDLTLIHELEGRAEALADTFNAQEEATKLWAYAKMGWKGSPGRDDEGAGGASGGGGGLVRGAGGSEHAVGVCDDRAGARYRELEGRAKALAGTFNAQDVTNTP